MILTKAVATGNDFVLIDLMDGENRGVDRAAWTRRLCDRFEGVGADGAVFLEPADGLDFRWDFYNSDGGSAEMCGNAARAVGLYVGQKTGRTRLRFGTRAGEVTVEVTSPDRIEVTLSPIPAVQPEADYTFVRAGVPHAVIEVPDARDWPSLESLARKIKARPEFTAAGVNVTFFTPRGPGRIDAVTFERGVEGFTRSCGTGAVAAAFASRAGDTVQVRVPGGDLSVVCNLNEPQLIGPARLVFRFDWLA